MDKQFWDALFESYPQSVKEFYDFIDEYKVLNNWNELFIDGVKFHNLPIELQLGVWIDFQFSRGCGNSDNISFGCDVFEQESVWEWTSEWFRGREININIENT